MPEASARDSDSMIRRPMPRSLAGRRQTSCVLDLPSSPAPLDEFLAERMLGTAENRDAASGMQSASRRKEAVQLAKRLVRAFLLQIMTRRHRRGAFDAGGIGRPNRRGVMVAADAALLAPQDHGGTADLAAGLEIGGIDVE